MNYQRRLENAVRKKWHTPELKEWWWTKFGAARRARTRRLSEAQGHRCAFCCKETYMDDSDYRPELSRKNDLATLEHVNPQHHGGTDNPANCVMSCNACNNYRGTMDAWEFYYVRSDPKRWLDWFSNLKKSRDLARSLRKEEEKANKPAKIAQRAFKYAYWTLVSEEYSLLFEELITRTQEAHENYMRSSGPERLEARQKELQLAQEAVNALS